MDLFNNRTMVIKSSKMSTALLLCAAAVLLGNVFSNSIERRSDKFIREVGCPNPVPGLDWIFYGFDITELDLLPWDHPASGPGGMKAQVVSASCDSPRVKGYDGGSYNYADQVHTIKDIPSGGCSQQSQAYKSSEEVYDRFSLNVGLEASYLSKFSFSASSSYNKMSKSVKKSDKFFSEASCTYSHLKVNLKLKSHLQLDAQAQSIVDRISEPFDANNYIYQPQWELIQHFGTHYFQMAILGGKYQMTYEVDKSYLSEHSESDLNVAITASANWGSGEASGSVEVGTEQANTLERFMSQTDKHENYFGGSTDLQKPESGREWQRSTYGLPWITSGEVKPIYDLIKDETKRQYVREAVEQYVLKTFVGNAAEQNVYEDAQIARLINDLSNKKLTVEEVETLRNLLVNIAPPPEEEITTLPPIALSSWSTFDSWMDFSCPGPNGYIKEIHSIHSNHHEDRKFQFRCARLSDNPQFIGFERHNCRWTPNYQNEWDRTMDFSCSDIVPNGFMVGFQSTHNNKKEDRRYAFHCCSARGTQVTNCQGDPETNWDEEWRQRVDDGEVIGGVSSHHNNKKEDRKFTWKICKLQAA